MFTSPHFLIYTTFIQFKLIDYSKTLLYCSKLKSTQASHFNSWFKKKYIALLFMSLFYYPITFKYKNSHLEDLEHVCKIGVRGDFTKSLPLS